MIFQKRPMRSSQVLAPFGVGAMVDFPGPESLIHAGLDAWEPAIEVAGSVDERLKITNEHRLAERLGVEFFVTPPAWQSLGNPKIPFLRFPQWHSCQRCGRMAHANLHDLQVPECSGYVGHVHPRTKMQQLRFVAACREGHLRDFPWLEWLHARLPANERAQPVELGPNQWLRLRATGLTGGAGLMVSLCRNVGGKESIVAERTLNGAFGGDPNATEGTPLTHVPCRSENPALGITPGHHLCRPCDAPLIVLLRGAGNLYFADIESVIHIPDEVPGLIADDLLDLFDDPILVSALLDKAQTAKEGILTVAAAAEVLRWQHPGLDFGGERASAFVDAFNAFEPLRRLTSNPGKVEAFLQWRDMEGGIAVRLEEVLNREFGDWRTVPLSLAGRIEQFLDRETGAQDLVVDRDSDHAQRRLEYQVLGLTQAEVKGRPKSLLKTRSFSTTKYDPVISKHFNHIGLLDTLRETRVLKGYSRLFARGQPAATYRSLMSRTPKNWLPATIVYGEGIFLRLDPEALASWESRWNEFHEERLLTTNSHLMAAAVRREVEFRPATPRFVLVHTLAHLMINQLVYESGYGTASLRERLYVSSASNQDDAMAGLLIYTAAGDSEGTLGGLVRLGEPGMLGRTLASALERAIWCSSDPVCSESRGQGPDNCNLAACHSCAMLPETSCEQQNRLMDRAVVVGTLERPETGFFSEYVR